MKKLHRLICNIPCQISVNGEKAILKQNIDVLSTGNFYATFLPINKKYYLPASIKSNNSDFNCDIQVVPFNTHTEILYSPTEQPTNLDEVVILSKKFNGFYFTVATSHTGFLNIEGKNFSHKSTLPPLYNASFNTSSEYVIITCKTSAQTSYVLLFCTKNKKIVIESCFDSIESTKNSIKCVKFYPTIAGYGIVKEFDYSTKKVSSYNVYKSNEPHICKTEVLVPYAFLESIKYGDFSLAKHYLENNLVSNEHLKTYFGDIKAIYFNGVCTDPNYTIFNGEYKNYTFKMNDGKISDIEENNINNN